MNEKTKSELTTLLNDLLSTIECASCVPDSDKLEWEKRSIQKLLTFAAEHDLGVVSLNGSVLK